MDAQVHPSALKHGLTPPAITDLWAHPLEELDLEDDLPRRVLRIACDDAGRWFELVAIVFDDHRTLAIHAMRLRRSTLDQIRRTR